MLTKKHLVRFLVLLPAVLLLSALRPQLAQAGFLSRRFVAVKTPIASAVTDYTVGFTITTATTLGSVELQFCEDSPFFDTPCSPPAGFVMNNATLTDQSGETGFTLNPVSTSNDIILSRAAAPSAAGPVEFTFTGVTNPSTPNSTVYMRIMTFPSTDASGTRTDQGAAAFSTAGQFGTAAYVPPMLYFCVGVTVNGNCSTISGDFTGFGDLTPAETKAVTTQCAAGTNDTTGYVIYTLGDTMTSGNHTIPAMSIQNPSLAGVSQFGLNLRANNNPNAGSEPSGIGTGTVLPDYATPNLFKFEPGAAVAQAGGPTDFNVYTTTYIANVSADQPAGVYATTITYMAVAQF